MEQALVSIFTLSFLVFSIVIAISVSAFRSIIEAIFHKLEIVIPDKAEVIIKDLWREWIVRALPVVVGGLFAYIFVSYPVPAEFAASMSGRVFFGMIAGLFSSTIYSFCKFYIKKYLPDNIKEKLDKVNPLAKTPKE